jgi:hypothetical protein
MAAIRKRGRYMPHWVKARRPKSWRREIFRQLKRLGVTYGQRQRMRDWTFSHIFLFMKSHADSEVRERREKQGGGGEFPFVERIRRAIE